MITFPSPLTPSGVAAAAPLLAPAPLSAAVAVAPAAPSAVESTAVELSRLSLFMSALALARKRLADQRLAAAADAGARPAATELADAEAASRDLAEAFNVLRASGVEAARTPADVLLEEQLLQTLAQPGYDSAAAFFTLPRTIPGARPTPADAEAARLRVDAQALRAAVDADPRQTLSRLERTGAQFAELAAALTQPADDSAAVAKAPVPPDRAVNAIGNDATDATRPRPADVGAPIQRAAIDTPQDAGRAEGGRAASLAAAPQRADANADVDTDADAAEKALRRTETDAQLEAERAAALQADTATQKRADLQADLRQETAAAQNRVADMALADLFAENHNTPPAVANPAVTAGADAGQDAQAAPAATAPAVAPRLDIVHASLLARDPAVAAALAAYHLNEGPFRTATNIEPAAASGARVPAVAAVQAIAPVAPVGAIGDARTGTGPRT